MQQVLEASEIQNNALISSVDGAGYPVSHSQTREARVTGAAEKTRHLVTLWRSIMSVFTWAESQYIPVCARTQAQHDSALGHISRIDPYLYIKSLAG
jgi:hypothetical protein